MQLIVQLVVWNGNKYLPYLFESLASQTFKDWHLLILDNNSNDGSKEWLSEQVLKYKRQYTNFNQSKNLGFAGGHNFLFNELRAEFSTAEYVLLLNQDMILEPDCFEKLVGFAKQHREAGSISPRLMRWDFEREKTRVIDTLGLKVFPTRRVVDWLTGSEYSENLLLPYVNRRNDGAIEVFGVSGALPFYRVSALKECLCAGNLFDADYGSYKEDVDLAWRLRIAGFRSFTVLNSVAYHDRTAAGPKEMSDSAARLNYQKKPDYVRVQSYRNHVLTLFKNEFWQNTLIDVPQIFCYELKKFIYLLFHYPRILLSAWYGIIKFLPRVWYKRREIMRNRKIEWIALRVWWDR